MNAYREKRFTKWQYKVIALSSDVQTSSKELNKLGARGWELVAVQGEEKELFAFLKIGFLKPKRKVVL